MTARDKKIDKLTKEKLYLAKLKDRLIDYDKYVCKNKFDNATTNKHVLEELGLECLNSIFKHRIFSINVRVAAINDNLTQMTKI